MAVVTQEMPKPRSERQPVPRSPILPDTAEPAEAPTAADVSISTAPPVDAASMAASPAADETVESRHEAIAHAAYLLAQARGFEPGHELDDWRAAEQQLTALC